MLHNFVCYAYWQPSETFKVLASGTYNAVLYFPDEATSGSTRRMRPPVAP